MATDDERLQAIVDGKAEAALIVGGDGHVLAQNAAAARLVGVAGAWATLGAAERAAAEVATRGRSPDLAPWEEESMSGGVAITWRWEALGQGRLLGVGREVGPDLGRARDVRPTPPDPPLRGSETLLLADDELPIRKAMRGLLESLGYSVLLAGDGQEAVDIYSREHERVRAVILDLTMPRLSGLEALEALLVVDPGVRVIISSGYSLDEMSGLPGVAAVLVKPYLVDQLARVVRKVLDAP